MVKETTTSIDRIRSATVDLQKRCKPTNKWSDKKRAQESTLGTLRTRAIKRLMHNAGCKNFMSNAADGVKKLIFQIVWSLTDEIALNLHRGKTITISDDVVGSAINNFLITAKGPDYRWLPNTSEESIHKYKDSTESVPTTSTKPTSSADPVVASASTAVEDVVMSTETATDPIASVTPASGEEQTTTPPPSQPQETPTA